MKRFSRKKPYFSPSDKSAFTLIELVMVIVLLGIVVSGILMYFAGTGGAPREVLATQAVFLAQEKMDELIGTAGAGGFDSIVSEAAASLPSPFDRFTREVEVFCVEEADLDTASGTMPDCSDSDIRAKRIRVVVSYPGGEVDLVTVLSDR